MAAGNALAIQGGRELLVLACKCDIAHARANVDSLAFQDLAHRYRHIRVLATDQARAFFQHGDAGAETTIHLRILQPDITSTDDQQMRRHLLKGQDRGVGQVRDVVQAGHVRHRGTAADIEEDPRRGELFVADAQGLRILETCMPLDHRTAVHAIQPRAHTEARVGDDGVGARLHLDHVDTRLAGQHHAEIRRAARHVRGTRAGNQGLGRHAAGIDAGTTEQPALDQRHRLARLGQPVGQRRTRLAGTDDDRVEAATHDKDSMLETMAVNGTYGSWGMSRSSQ